MVYDLLISASVCSKIKFNMSLYYLNTMVIINMTQYNTVSATT